MPTVRFSQLLCVLLMTALAGDLILLPAILAGPAGILFRLKSRFEKRTGEFSSPKPKFAKKMARMEDAKRSTIEEESLNFVLPVQEIVSWDVAKPLNQSVCLDRSQNPL